MPFLSPLRGDSAKCSLCINPACPVDGGQPVQPLCASSSSVSCTSHPIQTGISCSIQCSTPPCAAYSVYTSCSLPAVWCPAQCTTHHAPCTVHPMPCSPRGTLSRCWLSQHRGTARPAAPQLSWVAPAGLLYIGRPAQPRRGAEWSRLTLINPACHQRVFLGTAAAGICNIWSLRTDTQKRSWGKQQELGAGTERHGGEVAEQGT